jgi:outer membrane receptor protein involved in Fe transport
MNGHAPFQNLHLLKTGGGSHGTISASTVHQMTDPEATRAISVSTFGLHSDGFYAIDPSQRGPIDRKLDIDLWGADLKFAWLAAPGLTVEPMVSYYTEDRGNGTPISRNSTDALDLALRITSADGDHPWQALAWHQRREFEAAFSSVNDERSAETLALDQFDVPGRGTGAAFTTRWKGDGRWDFGAGADVRFLTGETNENAGTFRQRVAGGDQALAGIFATAGYQADEQTRVNASARLDFWQITDGRRLETSLATGRILREEYPPDREDFEPSASLEVARDLRDDLTARVSAGTGFRLPTLNELHRPYRVRNDIVEANPDLQPERFVSIEGGLDWKPGGCLDVGLTFFHHWISDAVANVPVTDPAEIEEIFGAIPPGGSVSQKRNVDEARVTGVEGKLEWRPHADVTLGVTGLWTDTRFADSPGQPLLEGKPFPQASEWKWIANAEWRPTGRLTAFASCEYGSPQFDDALASRAIPEFTSVGIGVAWRTAGAIYQARIDNLLDEEIQTGLSSGGIRTLGAPRSLWLAAEWEF